MSIESPPGPSELEQMQAHAKGHTIAPKAERRTIASVLTTTDHKTIGLLYMITAFFFFIVAGLLAEVMRAELARPGLQFVSEGQYNQAVTMHGTLMMFLFAPAMAFGFTNFIMPLQIGAPDVAFPRLNAISYWLYLFGGLIVVGAFLTPGGAPGFGWTAYTPLNSVLHAPGAGPDMWILGLLMSGLGTILGAVNFVTTIITMRAPGMTMFRMPIFTWNMLVTSILVIVAFPVLAAALAALMVDRHMGGHIFDTSSGGAILYQHLFWFFGHPEVYIVALPFFGIVSEVLPVFSRKPLFGYKGLIFATIGIGVLSVAVWAHHMFVTGAVALPFFSFLTYLIAVPTGVKFFNWIGTMWRGSLVFDTPMLWAMGFLVTFLFGGLTGVILGAPPLDFHVSDTYFVVAHFHYVLFGTVVYGTFSGVYYWWPKFTGRFLDERLGKWHFWLTTIGFNTTFLVQHWLGTKGFPRRYANYDAKEGFTTLNTVSSIGAAILAVAILPFFFNVYRTMVTKRGFVAQSDDPWGFGSSLEWATTCPPPRHNFTRLPRIRSERPAFDLHYPEIAALPARQHATAGMSLEAGH